MSNEREIGWLIERKYPTNSIGTIEPRWYAERPNGDHWWSPVPNEAKRFATKAQAEAYPAYQMIASDPDISITEHVWINDGFSWSHGRASERITDLRIALNDIIALDHHGPESRATEIARAALLRDDDTAAQ